MYELIILSFIFRFVTVNTPHGHMAYLTLGNFREKLYLFFKAFREHLDFTRSDAFENQGKTIHQHKKTYENNIPCIAFHAD